MNFKSYNCVLICLLLIAQFITTRGGVGDTRLEAKAKETKKIRGQAQEKPIRGQTLLRPRTGMLEAMAKDTAANFFQKKGLQKSFSGDLQFQGVPGFLIGEGPNHKSHAMTSSKIFKRGSFCGIKIS